MILNTYNPHSRYKARAMNRMANLVTMLCVIALSVAVGFWLGKQYGAEQYISMKEQLKELNEERVVLQNNVTELRAEAQIANTRYEQIKAEYNAQIPEGPMQDLTRLIREQLSQGMDPQRLAFVVRSARPPTGCTEPETKRFVVSTPAYTGPASTASVAEGAVTITGKGQSATNAEGKLEAWYNPAQGVEIKFTNAAGQSETKKGNLPIQHSMVVGDREYRFTVQEGAKSFAKVVFDSCAYP